MTVAALLAVIALAAPPATASQAPQSRLVKVTYYGIQKHHHKTRRACRRHWDRRCRTHVPRWISTPGAGSPQPGGPNPSPTPTPTPGPLPSRTAVDLDEWRVTPAYRELAAGDVEFNAANLGEDDHDFSVRDSGGDNLRTVELAPGQSASVRITLAAGVYRLYCSLPDHEAMGMRANVTVR